MFVMFVKLTATTTVRERQADASPKEIALAAQLKNTNLQLESSVARNCNLSQFTRQASIDKTLKTILPSISVESTTILSPAALANQPTAPKFILTELNNFRQTPQPLPPTQPVATAFILNDLSPIPAPPKDNNTKKPSFMSPMTPTGLPLNSPDVKAMRYYRLWIYTCNAVLLMAVIVFCGVAGKVLLADYKRLLISGLNLSQPSFIYAYLALLVQSGFLQFVGCLGALRLSEKLLNAYWLLLLVLLIGDALLGIFWMYKFDRIMQDLQPILRNRLAQEYGISLEWTELWDRLQNEGRCCGVIGPQDYTSNSNRSYPTSCCSPDITEQISRRPLASAVVFRTDDVMRDQQKNFSEVNDYFLTLSHVMQKGGASSSPSSLNSESKVIASCRAVYPQGCIDKLLAWLRHTADILFVIGYCVIAFLKLCFLGILRYEIKEMIQKIKLLQIEMATSILNAELGEQQLTQIPINGGILPEPKVGNRDRERTRIESVESERENLLLHDNTPRLVRHKQLYAVHEQSVDEFNAASASGGKTINGSNNYELSEFDSKSPNYRILSAPTVTKI